MNKFKASNIDIICIYHNMPKGMWCNSKRIL